MAELVATEIVLHARTVHPSKEFSAEVALANRDFRYQPRNRPVASK